MYIGRIAGLITLLHNPKQGLHIVGLHRRPAVCNHPRLGLAHAQVSSALDHLVDLLEGGEQGGLVLCADVVPADQLPVERVQLGVGPPHGLHVLQQPGVLRADHQRLGGEGGEVGEGGDELGDGSLVKTCR
jgi:hypothetical protein